MRKPDANEAAIVTALRKLGATVVRLESPLAGVPDLAVGFRGRWHLMEVKTAKGPLSEAQQTWHASASAPVAVVRSVEQALAAIGLGP